MVQQPFLFGLRGIRLRLLIRQILPVRQHIDTHVHIHLPAFQLQHLLLFQLLHLHREQILGRRDDVLALLILRLVIFNLEESLCDLIVDVVCARLVSFLEVL